jgi:hypothetical protein
LSGTAAIEAIDRIVDTGGDADDILRSVVGALVDPGGCSWAGILFVESGALVLGPQAGIPEPDNRIQVPVVFEGSSVAELAVDGCDDPASLDRIAFVISPYCLVGWDTDGEPWEA